MKFLFIAIFGLLPFSLLSQKIKSKKQNKVNDSIYINNSLHIIHKNNKVIIYKDNKNYSFEYFFEERNEKIFVKTISINNQLHNYVIYKNILILSLNYINNITLLQFINLSTMKLIDEKNQILSASWIYFKPNLESFVTTNNVYPNEETLVHFYSLINKKIKHKKSEKLILISI